MDFGNRRNVNANNTGSNYSVIDTTAPTFKFKMGMNRIIILPYMPTKNLHPRVFDHSIEKGKTPDWDIELRVHKNLPGGSYICQHTYGYDRACPVCEAAQQLKDAGKDTEGLFSTLRAFFNVVDLDDVDKGVQVLERGAKKGFLPNLAAIQEQWDRDAESQAKAPGAFFADIDNGLELRVLCTAGSYNGKPFADPTQITLVPFTPEVKQIAQALKDSVVYFDRCIKVLPYAELEAVYTGDDSIEEDDVPEPVAPPVVKPAPSKATMRHDPPPVPSTPVAPTKAPVEIPTAPKKNFWEDDVEEDIPF